MENVNEQNEIYTNLRSPKSTSIISEIKTFIFKISDNSISKINYLFTISNEYHNLIHNLVLLYSKIFQIKFDYSTTLFNSIYICLENIILSPINTLIFSYILPNTNNKLQESIDKYSNIITLSDCGINVKIDKISEKIINTTLNNIIKSKTPYNKIKNLINVYKFISKKYEKENIDLLLMYFILQNSSIGIEKNYEFIQKFKSKVITSPETEYILMKYREILNIINNLDTTHSFLTISETEFQNKILLYQKKNNLKYINIDKNIKNSDVSILVTMLNKIPLLTDEKNVKKNLDIEKISSLDSLPVDELLKKYFSNNKNIMDYNMNEIEQMYNDFKITLKVIESSNDFNK